MAEISYRFTRIEPTIDQKTNNVLSITIGVTADDGEGHTAYIDGIREIMPEETKSIGAFNIAEIRNMAIVFAVEHDWYANLRSQIEQQTNAPIRGSSIII